MIYRDMELIWSASLPSGTLALNVATFGQTPGLIVSVAEDGKLTISYLGSDPPSSAVATEVLAPLPCKFGVSRTKSPPRPACDAHFALLVSFAGCSIHCCLAAELAASVYDTLESCRPRSSTTRQWTKSTAGCCK